MRNEQIGRAELLLQVLHQVDHLRLDRDVQCGDRLICDDELGLHDQRAGDADALALAAGELVGIAIGVLPVQSNALHNAVDFFLPLVSIDIEVMHIKALSDNISHLFARIETGHGVLKDHLHAGAQVPRLRRAKMAGDFHALEENAARGRRVETND